MYRCYIGMATGVDCSITAQWLDENDNPKDLTDLVPYIWWLFGSRIYSLRATVENGLLAVIPLLGQIELFIPAETTVHFRTDTYGKHQLSVTDPLLDIEQHEELMKGSVYFHG